MPRCLIFIALIVFSNIQAGAALNRISETDRSKIKLLFEYLFKTHEPFSYTLFGDKPLSFSNIIEEEPTAISSLNFIRIDEYARFTLKENNLSNEFYSDAWEIWNKKTSTLKPKHFLFLKRKLANSPTIFLINKNAFHKAIEVHIDLFKKLLGQDINSKKILIQIEKENSDIWEILQHHHSLLGILLGFGKHNSVLFQKRESLENKIKHLDFLQSYKDIQVIKKRIDYLYDTLQLRNDYYHTDLAMRNSIGFVADRDHPESKFLEKKYRELGTKISDIYSKDDWFEQTLLQLLKP